MEAGSLSTENHTALVKRTDKPKKRRWLRTLITLAIIAVVLVGGYFVLTTFVFKPSVQTVQDLYTLATARKDTLEVKVQGTGNISSAKSYDIISTQPGKIEALHFEQGDVVDEGALLYEISNQDLEDAVTRAKNELKQSQITTEKQKNTKTSYYIDAPASGIVKKLKAKYGEDAATTSKSYGALCYIATEGKMRATITPGTKTTYVVGPTATPDPSATPGTGSGSGGAVYGPWDNIIEIQVGDWIYLLINSQSYFARVVTATQASLVCEMQTDAFEPGIKVEAYENAVWGQKIGEGTLELFDPVAVTGSGIITGIHVAEGQYVNRGDRLFDMDTRDLDLSLQSQSLSRQLTQDQLNENIEKLSDDRLYIPHGGILSQLNVKAGQNITGGMLIGSIVDHKDQEITLDVDELDIPKIKVGQNVDIRVDALPDDTFSGAVRKIGELGTTSGGMTTYPVTISINFDDKIRIGMSASADILVDKHENTLIVPLETVHDANGEKYVLVLAGGEASATLPIPNMQGIRTRMGQGNNAQSPQSGTQSDVQNGAQSGAPPQQNGAPGEYAVISRRVVQVGLTNESYTEILSGIQEGDVVLAPKSTNSGSFMSMFGAQPARQAAPNQSYGGAGGGPSGGPAVVTRTQ